MINCIYFFKVLFLLKTDNFVKYYHYNYKDRKPKSIAFVSRFLRGINRIWLVDGRSLKSRLLKWLQCILNKDWPIWSTNHNQVLFHNKTYCCWINWWGSLAEKYLRIFKLLLSAPFSDFRLRTINPDRKWVVFTKEYRALDFWMKNVLRHVVEANWIIFYGFSNNYNKKSFDVFKKTILDIVCWLDNT